MGFVLPRGCVDMGEMNRAQIRAQTDAVRPWVHAFAQSHDATVDEQATENVVRSFDVFAIDGLGLWLLHNPLVSVVGAITNAPEPGRGWAVDQHVVDLTVPGHLQTWGPTKPAAADLNARLTDHHWAGVSARARQHADTYKPETLAQVLFNYWD